MKICYIEIEANAEELRATSSLSDCLAGLVRRVAGLVDSASAEAEQPEDTEE